MAQETPRAEVCFFQVPLLHQPNHSKDKNRALVYVDELQAPEAITGRLNPENANPAFAGRDFVSAQGEINAVEPSAVLATSPNSDKPSIGKYGTPANINAAALNYARRGR
ncbi:MAG: hypothetical protein H6935_14045 [Thiobacillus sp.]|nr:hypothetical protein [Thiobacillus sp.]